MSKDKAERKRKRQALDAELERIAAADQELEDAGAESFAVAQEQQAAVAR